MNNPTPKIGFVSLGCPKATVDSERIISQLRASGYQLSSSYQDAELVVVNTCGFIDSAIEESMDAIGEAMNENGRVIVTGCLGKDADRIRSQYPEVLNVTGPHAYDAVMQAVQEHCPAPHDPRFDLLPKQGIRLTPPHYAYLKISEGCNHRCRFCIIPQLRGDLVSRPVGDVLEEAQRLVESGVKELLVVSQDTSAYGVDISYKLGFWRGRPVKARLYELAQELGNLGIWVRLHYIYPYPHVDNIIPLMSENGLLPYLDVPLQHASPPILKAMRRPAHSEKMLQRIHSWRAVCPDLTIRSTFIVGFPGETEEDFEQLMAFIDEAKIDRLGCFKYSAVDGAAANALPNPVSESVKQERFERLMEKQSAISRSLLAEKVGRTLPVLVDAHDGNNSLCRSAADAPEIDGQVIVENSRLTIGEITKVRIVGSNDYDLFAEMVS